MKFDTLVDLLRNALRGVAVGWSEGLVGAERAAARRDTPIAVGAPHRGIDRELLHSTTHQPAKVGRIAIETAGIWRFRIQNSRFKIRLRSSRGVVFLFLLTVKQ